MEINIFNKVVFQYIFFFSTSGAGGMSISGRGGRGEGNLSILHKIKYKQTCASKECLQKHNRSCLVFSRQGLGDGKIIMSQKSR